MGNKPCDPMLLYDKCQRLAAQAADRDLAGARERAAKNGSPIKSFVSFGAQLWVQAFVAFDKGLITEEELKSYFHLGFVPEYSAAFDLASKMPRHIGPLPRPRKSLMEKWAEKVSDRSLY